jgi:hypothetical protein
MGGKDSGGGGDPNAETMRQFQIQGQKNAADAAAKQKAAADEPVKDATAAKDTPPVDEKTQLPAEKVVPGSENLTGLGDAMVGGLSPGREQQVTDQTARVGADPQTYGVPFDPFTGTYQGQGPYTGGSV